MNTQIISAIAFKLFAIYIAVSVILSIPSAAAGFMAIKSWPGGVNYNPAWPVLIIMLTVIITIIVFKMLWRLGNSTIKNIDEINQADKNFDMQSFENSLFMFLGLFFAISAFVEIPNLATSLWLRSQTPGGNGLADYGWLAGIVSELLIGLWLLAKPGKWLTFIRNLGLGNKK